MIVIDRSELSRQRDGAQRSLIARTDRGEQLEIALHVVEIDGALRVRNRRFIDGHEDAEGEHADDDFRRGDRVGREMSQKRFNGLRLCEQRRDATFGIAERNRIDRVTRVA